jgi:uncharacterized membrane-anchored protein YitT (DUF2179 family)
MNKETNYIAFIIGVSILFFVTGFILTIFLQKDSSTNYAIILPLVVGLFTGLLTIATLYRFKNIFRDKLL